MRRVMLQRSEAASLTAAVSPSRLADRMALPEPVEPPTVPKKLGGLVLTRHLGESIMIGGDVELEVVGLKSGTARLKIIAPRSIAVHRREVYDEIRVNPRPASGEVAPANRSADLPSKSRGGLVLTRNLFQSIMIGDDVEVAVVEVRPTVVKLKIVAPRSVSVHRREVFEAIASGNA